MFLDKLYHDGIKVNVKFGKVLSEVNMDYFTINDKYIVNKVREFKRRDFLIFIEDREIYFDLIY